MASPGINRPTNQFQAAHCHAADRARLFQRPAGGSNPHVWPTRVFRMGQVAGGVYTAGVAGYQDELAELRAALEAVAGGLRDSLLPASGIPGRPNRAELARTPGVTPGRASCPGREGRQHPASGHG